MTSNIDDTSFALSIKMSILLYIPAVAIIVLERKGLLRSATLFGLAILTQSILAHEFLSTFPRAYLSSAFDLGRVFMYKWSVNWKLFSEDVFLGAAFSYTLLFGHVSALIYLGHSRWRRKENGSFRFISRLVKDPRASGTSREIYNPRGNY